MNSLFHKEPINETVQSHCQDLQKLWYKVVCWVERNQEILLICCNQARERGSYFEVRVLLYVDECDLNGFYYVDCFIISRAAIECLNRTVNRREP